MFPDPCESASKTISKYTILYHLDRAEALSSLQLKQDPASWLCWCFQHFFGQDPHLTIAANGMANPTRAPIADGDRLACFRSLASFRGSKLEQGLAIPPFCRKLRQSCKNIASTQNSIEMFPSRDQEEAKLTSSSFEPRYP